MPTGTIRLHDVIQSSNSGMTRPPSAVTLNSGTVRLFLSPVTFNSPGLYEAAISNGAYSFRNVNAEIQEKLDATRNSQAFFRIDTGNGLSPSLFRSNRYSETAFRSMRNVDFDLFRISVNEEAYITSEKVLEALVIPEFIKSFLESLSVRILGTDFDLVNENEIERILGNMASNINNFDVQFTNNGRLRVSFGMSNIRVNLPRSVVSVGNIIGGILGSNAQVCEEYFVEELNINLFLKVTPNRTVSVDDQINFTFQSVRFSIPQNAEVRGCPPANDNTNSAPDPTGWQELSDQVEMTVREIFRTTLQTAAAAALSPIHNGFMRYVNLEMESEFDGMMETVISETLAQYDIIDLDPAQITSTISNFRTVQIRRRDEDGNIEEVNALKPELVYGVLTSSRRIITLNPTTTKVNSTMMRRKV